MDRSFALKKEMITFAFAFAISCRGHPQPIVRPQSFGARGDGITNDTAGVVAAAAHCKGLGGCELLFENGIFFDWPL